MRYYQSRSVRNNNVKMAKLTKKQRQNHQYKLLSSVPRGKEAEVMRALKAAKKENGFMNLTIFERTVAKVKYGY